MTKFSKFIVAGVVTILLLIAVVLSFEIVPMVKSANLSAKIVKTNAELHAIDRAINSYHEVYNDFPTGSATTILSSLMGRNPKGIRFLVLGDQGPEAKDPWGEAYLVMPDSPNSRPRFYSKELNRIDKLDSPAADKVHN
jgi:hypothetical protein